MDIEILSTQENKSIGRKEIKLLANYAGSTPSRDSIKEELCRKLNLNPELVVIRKIDQVYGMHSSKAVAHMYTDKALMSIEPKYLSKREERKAAKKAKAAGEGEVTPTTAAEKADKS
jgi:ribosomal protein S24E